MFRSRGKGGLTVRYLAMGALSVGCTTVLGIDGQYTLDNPTNGAAGGANGQAGSGDQTGTGVGTSGGASGASIDAGTCPAVCASGQKCCAGGCVSPDPLTGCSASSCSPCTVPDHATATCNAEACGYRCFDGFEDKGGGICSAIVSGGSGGAGGAATQCDPSTCRPCTIPTETKCCNATGCGCQFPFSATCL